MSIELPDDFEGLVRANYALWSAGERDALFAVFEKLGPKGYTVEHVGKPVQDGPTAVQEMWNRFGGRCTAEIVQLFVNGNEAAAYVHNIFPGADGPVIHPSLETYKVANGRLEIRYHYQAADH
ncbi:MAG: hypothetical protein JWO33_2759 [Caulobacteraceae bacterium]|nr:hypothetical protein [Caulobacteraceae bacterium]